MVKTLCKSLREYKRASWQTALFAALEVVLEILLPFLTAEIIDQGIYGGSMDTLVKLGLIMIVLVVLGLIFGMLAGARAATGTHKELLRSNPIYQEIYTSQQKGDDQQ